MKSWVNSLVIWEEELFLLLNGSNSSYLDSVMFFISDKWPWVFFLICFFFLMGWKQKREEFLHFFLFTLLLIIMADGLSSGIIKPLFQRLRPTHHPITKDMVETVLGYEGGQFGFISGHTTNFLAFATFSALVIRNKWYTFSSLLAACTVSFSRIYLGVHFITDVIPGVIAGIFIGFFNFYLYKQGRLLFLGVARNELSKSYLHPKNWTNYLALLMGLFYLAIWIFAPLFIKLY